MDIYFIRIMDTSVSGLDIGAQVRYHGIRIGRVDDIYIDPEDITSVIIKLALKKDTPVKEDSKATVTTIGITGLKMIEIQEGTNQSPRLPSGGYIQPGVSTFDMISGKAEIIAEKMEIILNNIANMTNSDNQSRLKNLAENLNRTMANLSIMLEQNQKNFQNNLSHLSQITLNLIQTTEHVNRILAHIDTTVADTRWSETLENLHQLSRQLEASHVDSLAFHLDRFLMNADRSVTLANSTFLNSRHDIIRSVALLKETLENLNEFSKLISDDPSILIRGKKMNEINR